jgi:hypothetical protein
MDVTTAMHARRLAALRGALDRALLGEETPALILMDMDWLLATMDRLQHEAGYPSTALHTVAIKANPVGRVLHRFKQQGFGAEVRINARALLSPAQLAYTPT